MSTPKGADAAIVVEAVRRQRPVRNGRHGCSGLTRDVTQLQRLFARSRGLQPCVAFFSCVRRHSLLLPPRLVPSCFRCARPHSSPPSASLPLPARLDLCSSAPARRQPRPLCFALVELIIWPLASSVARLPVRLYSAHIALFPLSTPPSHRTSPRLAPLDRGHACAVSVIFPPCPDSTSASHLAFSAFGESFQPTWHNMATSAARAARTSA